MVQLSCGDLPNNFKKLEIECKGIQYDTYLDFKVISSADPRAFLPIVHHSLLGFSKLVQNFIYDAGHTLNGKKDWQFMETVY
jgi:centrosomal protein CEP44